MKKLIDDLRVVLKLLPARKVLDVLDLIGELVTNNEDVFDKRDLRVYRDKFDWLVDHVEDDHEYDPVTAGYLANALERMAGKLKTLSEEDGAALLGLSNQLHVWVETGIGIE